MIKFSARFVATLAFVLGLSIGGGQVLAFCIYNKMKYDDVLVWKGHSKVTKSNGKSCKKFKKGSFEHRLTGRCYTCPKGYKRSVRKISGGKACVKGKLVSKKEYKSAKYVGTIPKRNNKFQKKIKPGKRACCNWRTGGCNQHMTRTGKLRFSTDLKSSCKIPDRVSLTPNADYASLTIAAGPAPTPAIKCGTLKFTIQAGGSAHIYGRSSGSTGKFRAELYDYKGRQTEVIKIQPPSKSRPIH